MPPELMDYLYRHETNPLSTDICARCGRQRGEHYYRHCNARWSSSSNPDAEPTFQKRQEFPDELMVSEGL